MVNEWLAIQRVGEWAGLKGQELDDYLKTAREIHEDALEDRGGEFDLDSQYFEFLNQEVFSKDEIQVLLKEFEVSEITVSHFEESSVPIEEAFQAHTVVDYGIDEIADFVMLLKLIDKHQQLTGKEHIKPLEKFHSLVYMVNNRLSQEDNPQISNSDLEFGMLERTGYRYSFRKKQSYPWSSSLQRDRDRLFAWNLLDSSPLEESQESWDISYSVSLGDAAQMFLTRFESKLENFDSVLLKEWDLKQRKVLEDFADSSMTGIEDQLESQDRYNEHDAGETILNGRPKRFESTNQITERVTAINV
ncbi:MULTISPECIES: hypothetical protein [Halorussus]|uniref:hypothetical protein n=1 Tax=Halorussus TaxID=1070314 RepID=UPI0013B3F04D|nr:MULTISPECIES: hypothetical protein [Halorussus]NHN59802.1 hypothetical protein [Halorussus sp. JP-T4]